MSSALYSVPCPEAQAEQNRQATVASATAAHEGLALLSKSFKVNIPPKSSKIPKMECKELAPWVSNFDIALAEFAVSHLL